MADWHLAALEAALTARGWQIAAVHAGDDYAISASWEIRRSSRRPSLYLDFNGLDDMQTLPLERSYGCDVRWHDSPSLYFGRPGQRWKRALQDFVAELDTLEEARDGEEQTAGAN